MESGLESSSVKSVSPSLSDSTSSSRRNSTVSSYDYNPDDFPRACEIEEFQSPSFRWPPSRALSRQQTAGRLSSIKYGNLPKKIATKLKSNMDYLNILVSILGDKSVSSDVVRNAQHTIDEAFELITTYPVGGTDAMEMVRRLDTAIADMSNLLGVNAEHAVKQSVGPARFLAKSMVSLTVQLATTAGEVQVRNGSYMACQELKTKVERLGGLLWEAGRTGLHERPASRILNDTEDALNKAASLVAKCHAFFTLIPANAFNKISLEVEDAIGNVSWLLRVSKTSSSAAADDGYLGLPPIATNEPILCLIWEQIAKLLRGSPEDKADAAASLVSLTQSNDLSGRLIIKEGGVGPLLKLVKEGEMDAQESAAQALGLLARDQESVEVMVQAGACSVFTKVLKEGPMKVQAMVAWAVAELAEHYPQCRDSFAQDKAVQLLVGHLAFETVQDHSKYSVVPKATSIHSAAIRFREQEDPATKSRMKAMAARALCALAMNNSAICKSITEFRALLCFSVLLEKGAEEVRTNSAMALMEIAKVAERDAELRRFAFKPTSPAAKAVVDQLLRIVQKAEYSDLLIPSIIALGCLSKTFRAAETLIVGPLVKLLDGREPDVMLESAIALTKFAETENYLHQDHCNAIIDEGGAKHLVQLVYLGEDAQLPALTLMCYVAKHVPYREELAQAEVLGVLEWAFKQSALVQDTTIDRLLPEAKSKLELYQARGGRGFH